ncbi:A2ML1 protein, partial [Anhinga anhinga]|nr:A2ML1 protein [Anhinga anhinga]
HYMVFFPSVLYYPYTGKVHVHLMDLDKPVRVTLHLASSHGVPNVTLEEQGSDILQLNWPHFCNISTPPASVYEVAYLHVSIQGASLQVSQQKKVLVKALELGTLVQTDKDVYKPGQTGEGQELLEELTGSWDGTPARADATCPCVQDPRGNHVAEWREVSPQQGIVDLSFPLAVEPALGTYTIEVEGRRHYFSVKDYGLPHFEVLIWLPRIVTVKDKKIPLDVCGRYPSGKTFRGRAEASLCQSHKAIILPKGSTGICAEFSGQTGRNGCYSTEVPVASFNLTNFYNQRWLHAYASLLEEGTGKWRSANKSCMIVYEKLTITFENTDKFYKPGIPYTGTMLVKGTNGSALKEEEILLVINARGETQRKTLLTDRSGRASFELDTSGWNNKAELKDDPPDLEHEDTEYLKYQSATRYLYPFSSDSKSFLKILRVQKKLPCGQPQHLRVDYFFDEKATGIKLQSLDVVFLVLAKGTIASVLRKELPAEAGLRGSFSMELSIGPELAPTAKVLGYAVLPDGEMVADSTELKVAKCFPNKVNLSFSEQRAQVGSLLHLKVQAAPGSLCAVYAVDQRARSSSPKGKLNPSTVTGPGAFPVFLTQSSCVQFRSITYSQCFPKMAILLKLKILIYLTVGKMGLDPLWQPFQPLTVLMCQGRARKIAATDCGAGSYWCLTSSQAPMAWLRYEPSSPTSHSSSSQEGLLRVLGAPSLSPSPLVPRSEEGVWHAPAGSAHQTQPARSVHLLSPCREGGSAEVMVTVPDAITEWETRMFCTAPLGFGLAPATTLTAFKPFFVELALPYAVVHHEDFTLVATVLNYLRQCLRVQVTLVESAELEVSVNAAEVYGGCICADEVKTFQWNVRATSLGEVNVTVIAKALHSEKLCDTEVPVVPTHGHVDTETKLLMVQVSRVRERACTILLLGAEHPKHSTPEQSTSPSLGQAGQCLRVLQVVPGQGDWLGDNAVWLLLQSHQQHQMTNPPRSIFPQEPQRGRGPPCSRINLPLATQLMAFLASHSTASASTHIPEGKGTAKPWSRGCTRDTMWLSWSCLNFPQFPPGQKEAAQPMPGWCLAPRHGAQRIVQGWAPHPLQGGVLDEVLLLAYVTAAMLELGLPPMDPKMSSALQCLEASTTDDPYTLALLAYIFALVGCGEQQQARLQSLAQHSGAELPSPSRSEGQLYWQRKGKALPSSQIFWAATAPAEVEMTAYVLLAYLTQPQVSSVYLRTATQIVRWLTKQQNPYGGFASTQDTVVALQALVKYAALTYGSNGDFTVTVTSPTGTAQDFVLHKSNRLVLQWTALHELPGTYRVRAHGQGCTLVQVTLRYSMPPPPSTGMFNLRVETEPRECTGDASTYFCLLLWARGERPTTNMVVIEAKLPSGYIPNKSSVVELKRQKLVKKVEVQLDQVMIYLDQLTKEEETFTFTAMQDLPVRNLQPATVTLYDYYEMGE